MLGELFMIHFGFILIMGYRNIVDFAYFLMVLLLSSHAQPNLLIVFCIKLHVLNWVGLKFAT